MPRPATVPIIVGQQYPFYAELQQEYVPQRLRMSNYTGQKVTVLEVVPSPDWIEPGTGTLYLVRTADGRCFQAWEEEINGWNFGLGQYFWSDGTYGPDHSKDFLSNERS